MAYILEISFKNKNCNNYLVKNEMEEILNKLNIVNYYFNYELDGNSKNIKNNNCVYTITCNEKEIELLKNIIKQKKYLIIDCIYENNFKSKILYASSYYKKKNINNKDIN